MFKKSSKLHALEPKLTTGTLTYFELGETTTRRKIPGLHFVGYWFRWGREGLANGGRGSWDGEREWLGCSLVEREWKWKLRRGGEEGLGEIKWCFGEDLLGCKEGELLKMGNENGFDVVLRFQNEPFSCLRSQAWAWKFSHRGMGSPCQGMGNSYSQRLLCGFHTSHRGVKCHAVE